MLKFIPALVALLCATGASANFISCVDGDLDGGVGEIPVHNFEFSFDGQTTYYCGPQDEACGEMRGSSLFWTDYGKS
jgi:hypothetical protein